MINEVSVFFWLERTVRVKIIYTAVVLEDSIKMYNNITNNGRLLQNFSNFKKINMEWYNYSGSNSYNGRETRLKANTK